MIHATLHSEAIIFYGEAVSKRLYSSATLINGCLLINSTLASVFDWFSNIYCHMIKTYIVDYYKILIDSPINLLNFLLNCKSVGVLINIKNKLKNTQKLVPIRTPPLMLFRKCLLPALVTAQCTEAWNPEHDGLHTKLFHTTFICYYYLDT